MRLVSYLLEGRQEWGVVREGAKVIPGTHLLDGRYESLKQVLADGDLLSIAEAAAETARTFPLDRLCLLPVIPDPTHFFSAGLNYKSHIDETAHEPPLHPRFHSRVTTSLIGHNRPLIKPRASDVLDYEGELAVVVGKTCRHVSEDEAQDCIAGYTCFIDGSVRDYQQHSVTSGKNFFATGALGPWLVTADEFRHPLGLKLVTRLNGKEMQRATTERMIYSIARMIAYLSDIVPLSPGDIIATGTPEGVGYRRDPPVLLKPGDKIEVEVEGIGVLANPVEAEAGLFER